MNELSLLKDGYIKCLPRRPLGRSPALKLKHQLVSRELFLSLGKYFDSDGCQLFYAPFDVRLIKNRGVGNQEIDTVV